MKIVSPIVLGMVGVTDNVCKAFLDERPPSSKYKVRAQTRPLTMAAVAFRRTGARCAGSFSKSSLDLGGSSSSTFRKAVQDMPPSGGYPQVRDFFP